MTYTDNILSVYALATAAERREGMNWYVSAYALAMSLTPNNPEMGAGIIAALSPMTSWPENIKKARILVETGTVYGLTANTVKAQRILAGENPRDVLPKGRKTYAFFCNIIGENSLDTVTIDRHAYDIARFEVSTDNNRRIGVKVYREMAQAYLDAAASLGITGAQLQAITWVAWRRRFAAANHGEVTV